MRTTCLSWLSEPRLVTANTWLRRVTSYCSVPSLTVHSLPGVVTVMVALLPKRCAGVHEGGNQAGTGRPGSERSDCGGQGGRDLVDEQPVRLHGQLGGAFYRIGRDPGNRVVILTGTGDAVHHGVELLQRAEIAYFVVERLNKEARDLIQNLLNIDAPVIGAANGPAFVDRHCFAPSEIVIVLRTCGLRRPAAP